jgi:hypothetical protein
MRATGWLINAFDQRKGRSRVETWEERKLERAMGIEPTRAVLPELKNKRFGATANPKCD